MNSRPNQLNIVLRTMTPRFTDGLNAAAILYQRILRFNGEFCGEGNAKGGSLEAQPNHPIVIQTRIARLCWWRRRVLYRDLR